MYRILKSLNFLLTLTVWGQTIGLSKEHLILVHALFRHGDRTLDDYTMYPNDPYINETYPPYGLGQLTNRGKLREYELGQFLRKRYNDFLGDLYTPELLEAQSTYYNRTKMSLELVLAGLFPPTGDQIWHPTLNWQPIPYNYNPVEVDKVLFGYFCPSFERYYEAYLQTDSAQEQLNQYREVFEYLSEHSGMNVSILGDASKLYFALTSEYEWGLTMPEWTESVYPDPLNRMAAENYLAITGTTVLKQLNSGYLLQKILNDTLLKTDGRLIPENRRLFLYSAHEITIGTMLNTLNAFELHIPPYGSCLIFEVHNIDQQTGIKLYYEKDTTIEPELLIIPGCEEFCPLDKFIELTQFYLPADELCGTQCYV